MEQRNDIARCLWSDTDLARFAHHLLWRIHYRYKRTAEGLYLVVTYTHINDRICSFYW